MQSTIERYLIRSRHDENGHFTSRQDLCRCRPQHPVNERRVAARSDDDEVEFTAPRRSRDAVNDVATFNQLFCENADTPEAAARRLERKLGIHSTHLLQGVRFEQR